MLTTITTSPYFKEHEKQAQAKGRPVQRGRNRHQPRGHRSQYRPLPKPDPIHGRPGRSQALAAFGQRQLDGPFNVAFLEQNAAALAQSGPESVSRNRRPPDGRPWWRRRRRLHGHGHHPERADHQAGHHSAQPGPGCEPREQRPRRPDATADVQQRSAEEW